MSCIASAKYSVTTFLEKFLSWIDTNSIKMRTIQYFPNQDFDVVRSWLSLSNGVCQYSWLQLSFLVNFAPAMRFVMSSIVDSSKWSLSISLLNDLGFKHTCSFPVLSMSWPNQSVHDFFLMTQFCSISSKVFNYFLEELKVVFRGGITVTDLSNFIL